MATYKRIGRYEIIDVIGRGGMAIVYRAYDPRMRREVALKVLLDRLLDDDTSLERFNREVQTIAGLEHNAIVPVYDFGEEDGRPYMVMQLMTGGSLSDLLDMGRLTIDNIQLILDRIGGALDRAHETGVVHRDVKPANILFDDARNPYLADFGIVKLASSTELTLTNHFLGTPAYMSPEQVVGDDDTKLEGTADLYSLGIVLFEMLTGRKPFEAETTRGMYYCHLNTPVPDLSETAPELSADYQAILDRSMAKKPQQRYQSGTEMASAFHNPEASAKDNVERTMIHEEPGSGDMPETLQTKETAEDDGSSPPLKVIASALAALLLFGCVGIYLVILRPPLPEETDPTLLALAATVTAQVVQDTATAQAMFAVQTAAVNVRETVNAEATNTTEAEPVEVVPASTDTPVPLEEPTDTAQPEPAHTAPPAPIPLQGEIVFQSNRDGDYEIYIAGGDGSNLRQLTNNDDDDQYPRISPDGNRIAFQSERDGNKEIYVMDRDGGNQRRLTQESGDDRLPSWSPDGRKIVFSSNRANPASESVSDIYVMEADGSNQIAIVNEPAYESHPVWSVDDRLVFNVTDRGTDYWQIYTTGIDGFDRRRVTHSQDDEWSPEWSPDGQQILFHSERADRENPGIYVMSANGDGARLLYNNNAEEWGANWSADGNHILFTVDQPDDTADIFIMNADGSGVRRLIERGGYPCLAPLTGAQETATQQPGLTPTPSATKEILQDSQVEPSQSSLKVVFTKPTARNWQDFESIWKLTDFEDMQSSGTQLYSIAVNPDDTLRWSFSWCAPDDVMLREILAPLTVEMLIDGRSLPSSQILQHDVTASDGWKCRYWSTILDEWQSGTVVELEVDYALSSSIFDGTASYAPGNYHQSIQAAVR